MSDKVAYPLYGTAGVVVGFTLYEVFRCTIWYFWLWIGSKSDYTFTQQLKHDLNSIKERFVNFKKNYTEITANDLPVWFYEID